MLLGGEIGLDRPQFAEHLRVFSDIFLRLIKVIVAPLIFGTLVTGIAGHGNLRSVGRIGVKSLIYFEVVTTLALFIGLGAINISRAGEGLTVTAGGSGDGAGAQRRSAALGRFPAAHFPGKPGEVSGGKSNSSGRGVCGAFRNCAGEDIRSETRANAELLRVPHRCDVCVHESGDVLRASGRGRGDGLYRRTHGNRVLLPLGKLLLTGYGALLFFLLAVLLPIALFARLPIGGFVRAVAEPATIAFATSTSEAALPRAME